MKKNAKLQEKNNSLEQQFPFTVPRCWISPQFPISFSRFPNCLVAALNEEGCSFIFLRFSLPRRQLLDARRQFRRGKPGNIARGLGQIRKYKGRIRAQSLTLAKIHTHTEGRFK